MSINAAGGGSYQRTRLTEHGFPRGNLTRSESAWGFQTEDLVKAVFSTGKKAGQYVAVRITGNFNIKTASELL